MRKPKRIGGVAKAILIAAAVILLLELVLVIWLERKPDPKPEGNKPPASTTKSPGSPGKLPDSFETDHVVSDSSVEILAFEGGQIQTPYFPLHYPEGFSDLLAVAKTGEKPFTLEFYAILEGRPEQRLFDIRLGEDVPGSIGFVKTEAGKFAVGITFYRFSPDSSWTEDEINTVLAMQEAANDTIGQLSLEESSGQPDFRETAPESSVINMVSIQTPFCTLRYPVRLATHLVTEQAEEQETDAYSVQFSCKLAGKDSCPLFAIVFGDGQGTPLGTISDSNGDPVPVKIRHWELDPEGWSEEEKLIAYTMQEAVNDLIGQLPLE